MGELTYLALGARHALVPRVLRLARRPLAPHGDGDARVGEYQHQQRHDELQREQGQRVVVALLGRGPDLAADVSDVARADRADTATRCCCVWARGVWHAKQKSRSRIVGHESES